MERVCDVARRFPAIIDSAFGIAEGRTGAVRGIPGAIDGLAVQDAAALGIAIGGTAFALGAA